MRALVLVALLLAAAAPLRGQGITPQSLEGDAGFTVCVSAHHAISFLSTDYLGTDDAITAPAHEAKHRQQIEAMSSCEAANALYATPAGRLGLEGAAYAVGYCAGKRAGLDPATTYADIEARYVGAVHDLVPDLVARVIFAAYVASEGCAEAEPSR